MASFGRAWVWLLALAALIAWGQWHLVTVPAVPGATAARAEAWTLPAAAPNETAKAIESLNRTRPWGAPAETKGPQGPAPWRIMAIFANGNERVAVVRAEGPGQREQILKAGQNLPDGSRIEQIRPDAVVANLDGKSRTLSIYQKGPQR